MGGGGWEKTLTAGRFRLAQTGGGACVGHGLDSVK